MLARVLICYVLPLLAAALPLVFRRNYGVRVLSAFILGGVGFLHFGFLMTSHRLVMEDVVQGSTAAQTGVLPSDVLLAIDSIQKMSQQEMWSFALLLGVLLLLVLLPFRKENDEPTEPTR
jgi:hypothetical protein